MQVHLVESSNTTLPDLGVQIGFMELGIILALTATLKGAHVDGTPPTTASVCVFFLLFSGPHKNVLSFIITPSARSSVLVDKG